MVKVSSTIKLNEAKLNELTRQQYISLAQTADAVLTDIRDSQTMPFDTGNLQDDSTFLDDSQKEQGRVSVVSSTPYARRLYYHSASYQYQMALSDYPLSLSVLHPLSAQGLYTVALLVPLALLHSA